MLRAPRAASPSRRAGPLLLAAALLASACDRSPALPAVGPVRVAEGALAEPLREAGLDADRIAAAARTALARAGFPEGDGEKALRVRIDVLSVRLAPPRAAGGTSSVEVVVEVGLTPPAGGQGTAHRESAAGAAPLAGDVAGAWSAALADATRRAAEGLAIDLAQEKKSVEQLIADLDGRDPRVREAAVRVLADRRSPAAVPALIARLGDADPEVRHRAVGALAQIRDARAVGPLIDVSRRGDPAFTARLARIIGDIGGSEARGYLQTLEAGHVDPQVQAAARDALADMDRRAADAAGAAAAK